MMKTTATALTLLLISIGSAQANLLGNGDFEAVDNSVGTSNGRLLSGLSGTQWDVYSALPGGWTTYSGPGIEIQNNSIVTAHSGSKYVELDSHPGPASNVYMFQWFDVLETGDYNLSFWYRPRTDRPDDNGIGLYLGDPGSATSIGSVDGLSSQVSDWTYYSFDLGTLLAGTSWAIGFQASGSENTFGGFLDDISVDGAMNPVPEPATLLLFGTGFAALGARCRRKK